MNSLVKKIASISLLSSAVTFISNPSLAEEPDKVIWEQSGWRVSVMTNTSGRFIGCYAVKDFEAPIFVRDRFVFANYRDGHWAALVGGTRIDSIAQQQPISLYLDGKLIHRATPQLTSVKAGRLGTLTLQAIDGLAAGHVLEMISPAGRDSYQLTGTADALWKTVECVNTAVALEQGRASDSLSYQFRVPSTVDAGFMNMRSSPSMASQVIATVPAGERLQKVGDCRPSDDPIVKSPWCYMQWHGMTGHLEAIPVRSAPGDRLDLQPVLRRTGSVATQLPIADG